MAYSQGGLIEATDYNNLINGTNQLNTVWSNGFGDAGYGQTAITTVAATNTVTATQWATLINTLNSVRNHQIGVGSGITAVTAGQTINHLSTLQTQVNAAFNDRVLLFAIAQGSTITGVNDATNPTAGATSAFNNFRDTNVTFSSATAARYFFNAGGQINFVCSATSGLNNTRSNTLRDMINQVGGVGAFRNTDNGGRTGTGGTIVVNNAEFGYRNLTASAQTIVDNDISGTYSAHDVKVQVFTNTLDTINGSRGASVVFRLFMTAAADDAFGGGINLTVNVRADVVFPSTTHLTNVWGTPTITFDSV